MDHITLLVAVVIVTALAFDVTDGFHDTANATATSVATGARRPGTAVLISGVLNVGGAFLATEVAKTISGGIVDDTLVTPGMIFAGPAGAILWSLPTWLLGLPSSSSPALADGLSASVVTHGENVGVLVVTLIALAVASFIVVKSSRNPVHGSNVNETHEVGVRGTVATQVSTAA